MIPISPSNIVVRQNAPEQIRMLAAQRYLYSNAKLVQLWSIILSGPVVVAWSLFVLVLPNLKPLAALYGVAVFILDWALFTPRQKSLKETAASIQERFDCEVLQLDWRSPELKPKPSKEDIVDAARSFERKYVNDPEERGQLPDWYPAQVDRLSIHLSRIVCQRMNCWWDGKLRHAFANGIFSLTMVSLVVLLVIGIASSATLEQAALTAPIVLPILSLGLKQQKEHRDSADKLDRLHNHAGSLWDEAMNNIQMDPDTLTERSRNLQDEIYRSRQTSPLVFDRTYQKSRDQNELTMQQIAEQLVQEAEAALRNTP